MAGAAEQHYPDTRKGASNLAQFLIATGWMVMLGPIAIFFFMSGFSKLFDSNTILFWHYLSAFGFIIYFPAGLAMLLFGQWLRKKARGGATQRRPD
jgi:hypothetical protein